MSLHHSKPARPLELLLGAVPVHPHHPIAIKAGEDCREHPKYVLVLLCSHADSTDEIDGQKVQATWHYTSKPSDNDPPFRLIRQLPNRVSHSDVRLG